MQKIEEEEKDFAVRSITKFHRNFHNNCSNVLYAWVATMSELSLSTFSPILTVSVCANFSYFT